MIEQFYYALSYCWTYVSSRWKQRKQLSGVRLLPNWHTAWREAKQTIDFKQSVQRFSKEEQGEIAARLRIAAYTLQNISERETQ